MRRRFALALRVILLAVRLSHRRSLEALPAPPLGKGNSNWAEYRLTLKLVTHEPGETQWQKADTEAIAIINGSPMMLVIPG